MQPSSRNDDSLLRNPLLTCNTGRPASQAWKNREELERAVTDTFFQKEAMERQLVSTYKRKFEDFAVQHGFDIQEDFYMPDDLPYPPKMRRWLELRIAFHDKRTELRALQAELKRFPKPKSATSCWSGCCTF